MADNLEKLKKKRTALRTSTTRIINAVQDKLSAEITNDLINELRESYDVITEKKINLKALDDEIQNLLDVTAIEEDFNVSEDYSEKCTITCSRINRLINENSVARPVQTTGDINSTQFSEIRNERNTSFRGNNTLKLPKLTIEKFWGDPKQWNEFWNSFESSVDKNETLSKVEKLVYLKSFLAGAACNVALGFELTDSNYDSCVALLKERYGRKDLLINSFMNKILSLEGVKNSANVKALRKLFDELDVSIRNLEALQVTSGSYGHLLIPILLKLIPEDLVLEFHRQKKSKDEVEVSELVQFVKGEVECREASNLVLNERKKLPSSRFDQSKYETNRLGKNTPTAAIFQTSVINKCIFCSSLHDSYKCEIDVYEKIKKLRSENRCFCCFRRFHLSKRCRNKTACKNCGNLFHHYSICGKKGLQTNNKNNNNEGQSTSNDQRNKEQNIEIVASVSQGNENNFNSGSILLQTATVYACSNSNYKVTRIIFDQGSQRSFITKDLSDYLNLIPVRFEKLSIFSFGSKNAKCESFPVVKIELFDREKSNKIELECLVSDIITNTFITAPSKIIKGHFERLGLQIADMTHEMRQEHPVEILIGAEYFWDCVYSERIKINKDLCAINSKFGWLAAGVEKNKINKSYSQNSIAINNVVLMNDLRAFWELDNFGITDCDTYSNVDTEIIDRFERNLTFKNGRYEVKLLWKNTLEKLGNNFEVAKKRFVNLKNKLDKTPEICEQYKKIIESQLSEGIVEECPNDDSKTGYYMPHRAVVRQSETTGVRIVYDASSKTDNVNSLNDCLESGPNLNPNILDIMLKFRKFKVAFNADIEKAFLMIAIAESDRKFLKFLWYDKNTEHFKIMQMCRVAFGLTISPFILAATIKYHIRKYKEKMPECFEMLNNSLYVDDLYESVETAEEAYRLSVNAINIFKEAGMNLRKLRTNSVILSDLWVKDGIIEEPANLNEESNFLGMIWNSIEDRIMPNFNSVIENVEKNKGHTKRQILRIIAMIYDPIGFLAPFIIRAKIMLQEIWSAGIEWDEIVPDNILGKWHSWCKELHDITQVSIQRNYFDCNPKDISLHIFADASPKAYGASAYFRYCDSNMIIKTCFIMAKSRVAPLKPITLPRLELLGALVAARMYKYLKNLFRTLFNNYYLWSDSEIAITWLRGSPNNWKPFVSNRVAEIQATCGTEMWNHCAGIQNPADLLTRGISASALVNSDLWWHGPHWLNSPTEYFPKVKTLKPSENLLELRKNVVLTVPVLDNNIPLLKIDDFSSLSRLLRITAWVMRFVENSLKRSTQSGPLSAEEIKSAEIYWIKYTQMKYFKKEIADLSEAKFIEKSSAIYSLNPELDENGILRLKGRLEFANCPESAKHPWLLPSKCRFVDLLITDAHDKVLHAGVESTLNHLREKFWIIKGRQRIKAILHKCITCKRYSARPGVQDIAPLPPDRIIESPPFAVTGLDYAGPFFTKENNDKHYLLIFTCAVTRAVHLELVPSMHTEYFLLAFRRFISRRGLCSTIYSDNAKSFKRADIELKKLWKNINDPSVKDYFSSQGINWRYIVERGAWWGGFWERMIRTIKTSLRKIVGRSSLSLNELETIFVEIEAMINSRPITYLYSDPSEPTPLTPAHFLIGKRLLSLPPTKISKCELLGSRKSIVKKYKHQQNILNHFWRCWKKSYLLLLKSANTCHKKSNIREVKPNDIVLIGDDRYPRNMWAMGRINEIFKGRDGKVRSCSIKTESGIIKRPVQLLYNMEITND